MKKFPVVEIFGPTIQGEGVLAGRPTHFVRFGGCDYRCSWCDSGHAVLPELVRAAPKLTTVEIIAAIKKLEPGPRWVTLSGGNPALLNLTDLVLTLRDDHGFQITIETQGSIWPEWLRYLDLLTVSPKPPSSGNVTPVESLFPDDAELPRNVALKVVVFDDKDYEYAAAVHEGWMGVPFYLSVGTLSGGLDGSWRQGGQEGRLDTPATLLERYRWLAEKMAGDFRMADAAVLPQLHYLLWGDEKGR